MQDLGCGIALWAGGDSSGGCHAAPRSNEVTLHAYRFDSVDAEDVPQLINVEGAFPAGLDLFDWAAPLPQPLPDAPQPVSTGAAGSNDPQLQQQLGQQEAVEQMEDFSQEGAQAAAAAAAGEPEKAAAKPKKKALTRAEKKNLERAKNREIQARYRQRQRVSVGGEWQYRCLGAKGFWLPLQSILCLGMCGLQH